MKIPFKLFMVTPYRNPKYEYYNKYPFTLYFRKILTIFLLTMDKAIDSGSASSRLPEKDDVPLTDENISADTPAMKEMEEQKVDKGKVRFKNDPYHHKCVFAK